MLRLITQSLLYLGLLFIGPGLWAQDIRIPSEVPLGLAFDGRYAWVSDARSRQLSGYDFEEQKFAKAKRLRLPGVRDIAFYKEYLVSVYPKYIFVINPINGDVVEKKQISILTDPVSIALNGDIAYIYDRKQKRFFRYSMTSNEFFGSFSTNIEKFRGATFYKGSLWAVDKTGRANKINPTSGEILSFVPLPERSYGIHFIKGNMYVSRPGNIEAVDYIESDYYVAASRKQYFMSGELGINFAWAEAQREKETSFKLSFFGLPFNAHQRHRLFKAKPKLRLKRRQEGESLISQKFDNKDDLRKYSYQVNLTTFNLTHILNKQAIRDFYKISKVPSHTYIYLRRKKSSQAQKQKGEKLIEDFKKRKLGTHPYQMVSFLKEQPGIKQGEIIYVLRTMGVPARKAVYYDILKKKNIKLVQLYIKPVGWVTIGSNYSSKRAKEFPIENNLVELYYPESIKYKPKPKKQKAGAKKATVDWQVFSVTEAQSQ